MCVCSECLGFFYFFLWGGSSFPGASLVPCQQPEFQQAGGAFHFEVGSEAASMNHTNISELSILSWAGLEGRSAILGSSSSVMIVARAVQDR